jgi:hypothetical protein
MLRSKLNSDCFSKVSLAPVGRISDSVMRRMTDIIEPQQLKFVGYASRTLSNFSVELNPKRYAMRTLPGLF